MIYGTIAIDDQLAGPRAQRKGRLRGKAWCRTFEFLSTKLGIVRVAAKSEVVARIPERVARALSHSFSLSLQAGETLICQAIWRRPLCTEANRGSMLITLRVLAPASFSTVLNFMQ